MRICLLNNSHPFSGIGKYAFNLLDKLTELDKPVEMVYFESKDNKIGAQIKGVKKVGYGSYFPLSNRTLPWCLSWYYNFPPKAPEGYDLYHASSQYLARVAKFRKNTVITHMDLAPVLFPADYPFLLRFFLKRAYRFYSKAPKILTISESARRELLEFMKIEEEKVKAIPLGFDEKIFKPIPKIRARKMLGLPLDKKIVLNVGSEEPRKNIVTLIRAFMELDNSFDDIMLVRVGGTNPVYSELKKGLDIQHFSSLPEDKMPFVYSAADVFVFPATYEGGFAYPPLEAMACAVPTIVGKELEMFKEGAIIAKNSYDNKEIAELVARILSSNSLMKKEAKKALNASKKFTLTREALETFAIYEEVLNRK